MKDKIILIIAVLAGLLAFLMTHQYLKNEREKIYAGAAKIKVLVAKQDLPAGAILRGTEDLAQKSVFKSAVGANVFKPEDLGLVINKSLLFSLNKGDPLMWSYVDMPENRGGGLASRIQPGLRAVSIAVGGEAAVSGLVQPNDHVDILGTFTFASKTTPGEMESMTLTVLQDVTILATGRELAGPENTRRGGGSSGYSMVTLEVTPREAELLVFAQHVRGQLFLTLRNTEDVGFESELPDVDFQHLETKLPEYNRYRQKNIRKKKNL